MVIDTFTEEQPARKGHKRLVKIAATIVVERDGHKAMVIGEKCEQWQLSGSITDTAKHMYKMAEDSRAFKGKSVDAIVAGCIFLSCRQNNNPRSFRELHHLTGVPKKDIGRVFKLLDSFFNKQNRAGNALTTGGQVIPGDAYKSREATSAPELCRRYCNALGMPARPVMLAQSLAERMVQRGCLAGRSPLSACAACIFMLSHLIGQPLSPRDIAPVAGVSDGTIRTAYKLLYNFRESLLIEDDWAKEKGLDVSKLPVV